MFSGWVQRTKRPSEEIGEVDDFRRKRLALEGSAQKLTP